MEYPALKGKTLVVGIGAQKAGTTWLYRYLRAHPQVGMSPIKELHYWDERYRPDLCGHASEALRKKLATISDAGFVEAATERLGMRDGSDYMRYFSKRIRPDAVVFGEVTPSYSILPEEGFRALKGLHDRVKLVLMLRDPVSRFWSSVCQKARRGPEPAAETFERALCDPRHVERTRYDVTLERVDRVFGADDVLVLFYETLFATRDIRPVTDFIGIGAVPAPFEHRVNRKANPPSFACPRKACARSIHTGLRLLRAALRCRRSYRLANIDDLVLLRRIKPNPSRRRIAGTTVAQSTDR